MSNGRENLGRFGQAHLSPKTSSDAKSVKAAVDPRDLRDPISAPHPMTAAQFLKHGKKVNILSLCPLHLHSSHQIVAIGRNYLDHVKELNNAVPREPFFFLKPTSSYLPSHFPGAKLQIPRGVLAHHEGSFVFYFHLDLQTPSSRTWPCDRSTRS